MKRICTSTFVFLLLMMFVQPERASEIPAGVVQTVHKMLERYAEKDVAGVMDLISDKDILIMGSDLSEVCTNRAQVEELLRNDFQLWESASFGEPARVFTRQSGNLISAFFEVPFTMHRPGQDQTVVIRFSTVWMKTSRGLKLVQSANTVPTVGQSAKEILSPKQ